MMMVMTTKGCSRRNIGQRWAAATVVGLEAEVPSYPLVATNLPSGHSFCHRLIIIIVNIITILNIQVNQITSYLDGSNLYGSSSTDQVLILDIYYSLFFIILSQVKILDISYSLFINDSSFIIIFPLTSTG